ncbi:hypothetical protein F1188_10965 [Roseospira marina]|uniref:Phosphoribosyltransferase n=1 Tax=Roseospira marina TaxID=140057 RepID=A0A5M6IAZ6_9PROT|nr:hypothetical protein [Roseospira marina]KAA5605416.1 hypothetical protein F1188_10965 [Roseospira marina]MBB4314592.1 hypothetical protein [Roseospira marina]MBB5088846.1 hypothetical protein [Roseospira marina]
MSIPSWTPFGTMMYFPRLDASGHTLPVYTIGWRFTDDADEWSRRFIGFKNGEREHLRGAARALRYCMQDFVYKKKLKKESTGLLTAIYSSKTRSEENSSLYILGKWLSAQLDVKFLSHHLTKEVHRSLHSLGSRYDRDSEVFQKYRCTKITGVTDVIILDDLVTRGATFKDISRSIEKSTPGVSVYGIALAKNERVSYAKQCGASISNGHIPENMNRLWIGSK